MSYSVKFSPIYGMYNGTTYEFNWPNELSERNQLLIQNIVYDYNKLAFNIEKSTDEAVDYSQNVYFLLFEEGATLFCIREILSENGVAGAALMGMFIRREYLSTSWLMMNVLINFCREYDFQIDSLEGEVYENELEDLYDNTCEKMNCSFALDNSKPYSFSIAVINPRINGVKFFPLERTIDSRLLDSDIFKLKSLDNAFGSRYVNKRNVNGVFEDECLIKRNTNSGGMSFREILLGRKREFPQWVVQRRNQGVICEKELKIDRSKKLVRFQDLIDMINGM
jgi:hypothetical protein